MTRVIPSFEVLLADVVRHSVASEGNSTNPRETSNVVDRQALYACALNRNYDGLRDFDGTDASGRWQLIGLGRVVCNSVILFLLAWINGIITYASSPSFLVCSQMSFFTSSAPQSIAR